MHFCSCAPATAHVYHSPFTHLTPLPSFHSHCTLYSHCYHYFYPSVCLPPSFSPCCYLV
ncbi:hypothetical protein BOTBODRAFT_567657 [Botryobasidium botryosum FD-172 SS1]|uniref:Uncharacterized protein n=1 Tax=Botryobasidium botryosum (strain FD-172 SS1) TaxID=930990 RepID=A0A067LYC5_BOTB1|nr:hypothetical protein BOTBODRAFT_567657 [Botryobasidium botryosum FD-172 SS1]